MKKMKSGFTLAEVLITLGIIGVIAAIVMPSVMTNYTYKTVGVKLSKFAAQLEGATRPYVVQNNAFASEADVNSFINESLIIKSNDIKPIDCSSNDKGEDGKYTMADKCGESKDANYSPVVAHSRPTYGSVNGGGSGLTSFVTLKDGVMFEAYTLPVSYDEPNEIKTTQVGEVAWGITVDPAVSGLPKKINRAYSFVVTELGYVYPDRVNDSCIAAMYDKSFEVNPSFFNNEDKYKCSEGQGKPTSSD